MPGQARFLGTLCAFRGGQKKALSPCKGEPLGDRDSLAAPPPQPRRRAFGLQTEVCVCPLVPQALLCAGGYRSEAGTKPCGGWEAAPGQPRGHFPGCSHNRGPHCGGPGRLETCLRAVAAPSRGGGGVLGRRDLRQVLEVGGWHSGDVWFVFRKWSVCFSSTTAVPACWGRSFAYRVCTLALVLWTPQLSCPGQKVKVGVCEQANPPAPAFLCPLPPGWRAASRLWRAARPLPGSWRQGRPEAPRVGWAGGSQPGCPAQHPGRAWLAGHCWWAPLSLGEPHSFVGPWGAPAEEFSASPHSPPNTAPAASAGSGSEAALQVSGFGGRFQPLAQRCGWQVAGFSCVPPTDRQGAVAGSWCPTHRQARAPGWWMCVSLCRETRVTGAESGGLCAADSPSGGLGVGPWGPRSAPSPLHPAPPRLRPVFKTSAGVWVTAGGPGGGWRLEPPG